MRNPLSATSLQTRLVYLVLGVVLPFSALLIWFQTQDEQKAREAVYGRMSGQAQARADSIGQIFEGHKVLLERLASRPAVLTLDPDQCDPLITELPQVYPRLANLALRRADASMICSHFKGVYPTLPPSVKSVLDEGLKAPGVWFSNATLGIPSKGWLVAGVMPLAHRDGVAAAGLVLSVDLLKLNELVFLNIPPEVTVGVFDRSETFVLRSRDPEKWIGQPITPANRGKYNQRPTGQEVILASDGVRRLYAWTTVPGLGWRVSAGVPEAEAMAPYWRARNRTLLAMAAFLCLAIYLAYRLARSINRPVSQLVAATQRMAAGDFSVRADVSGPRELRTLATQFNAMLEVRAQAMTDLQDSETRWKFAIEGAGDGLWDWNAVDNTVYFSPRWKTMLGHTEDEVGNALTEWSSRVHPEDMASVMADLQPHLDGTKAQYVNEHRVRCKDGSYKWILDRGLVVARDAAGKPLRLVGTHSDITQRKQEQVALRRSEDRYRELLNVSPVPCALNDSALNISFLNRTFVETFGYTLQDIPDLRAWWALAYPDPDYRTWVAKAWQARVDTMHASGKPFEALEVRICCKDGSERCAIVSTVALSSPLDDVYLVAFVDITERKDAEAALREADLRFRDLIESTDGIVWEADAATFTFKSISANAERMLGYPLADWLQPGFWASHIHPDDHDTAVQYCVACTGRLENHDFEYRFITADGRMVWLRDIVKVVSDSGSPRWLRGLMIDITQSRKDAETLRTNSDLLEYSQAAAKVGGWELTIATGHLYWTAETYRIHETSPDEFNPTVDAGVSYFVPESREKITEALGHAIGQGLGYALELQTNTTKGNLIDVFTTCTVSWLDGKPFKLTGIFQDITAQKAAQRAIEAANLELARSNADLEQFAYVASHDLQEPLRSVSSSVQLLKRRYNDALDDRAQEFIAHAVGGVQRMQAVIDDLLAYSRVASGPRVLKLADLEGALQIAIENLSRSIIASQAKVTHDPLPTVQANSLQIGQLFQNLIGNALKFRGDKPAAVHIGAVNLGTEWQFSVADQGIGIEPTYFERVFKLFQRLHTRTEYEGTGIGLTICQKIVERHGGRIWVESTPGQGSTFFFTLPNQAF